MTKANRIGEVEGLGEVYQAVGPLDAQIEVFQEVGIQPPYLVDPQDVVQIRLAGLSDDFSRTSLAPLAVRSKPTILVRPSPLMNNLMARFAIIAHRNGRYPTMSTDVYDTAEDLAQSQESLEPEDRTAIILPFEGNVQLTPEMPVTRFALGRRAKEYFEKKVPKGKVILYNLQGTSKKETDVNYTWFGAPRDGSNLCCRVRDLNYASGAFGVRFGNSRSESHATSGYDLATIKNANSQAVARFLQEKNVTGLTKVLEGLDTALVEELRNAKQ